MIFAPSTGGRWLALLCSLLFLASQLRAQPVGLGVFADDPDSSVSFKVENPLEIAEPSFVYLRFTVTNKSGTDVRWQPWVHADPAYYGYYGRGKPDLGYRKRLDVLVPARATIEFDLPLGGELLQSGGGLLNVGKTSIYYISTGTAYAHFTVSSRGVSSFTSPATPGREMHLAMAFKDFPTEALGFASVEQVNLLDDEWSRMTPQQQAALLDWVSMGGVLRFWMRSGRKPPEDLIRLAKGYSGTLGEIIISRMAERNADDVGGLADLVAAVSDALAGAETSGSSSPPPPAANLLVTPPATRITNIGLASIDGLPPEQWGPSGNRTDLAVILAIFGVVAGPMALLYLARKNPLRILWVLPVMSVIACAVIGVRFALSDGLGSRGTRTALHIVQPDGRVSVIQRFVLRSGLLFDTSFDGPDSGLMLPANNEHLAHLPNVQINKLEVDGGHYSGDWLQNRRVASLVHVDSVPAVMGIALEEDEVPTLTSTIPAVLDRVVVCDSKKQLWIAESVQLGSRMKMREATRQDWDNAVALVASIVDAPDASRLIPDPQPGTFIAHGRAPQALAPPPQGVIFLRELDAYIGSCTEGGL